MNKGNFSAVLMYLYSAFGDYIKQNEIEEFNNESTLSTQQILKDTIIKNNNDISVTHKGSINSKSISLFTTDNPFFETYSKLTYSMETRDQGRGSKGGSFVRLELYINDKRYDISENKLFCAPTQSRGRRATYTKNILLSELLKDNKIDKSKLKSGNKYSIKLWLEALYPQHRAIVTNITLTLTKF